MDTEIFSNKIYKINQISFNQNKSQFCLCCNLGIQTYDANTFEILVSDIEGNLGDIKSASLIHNLNIIVFVGNDSNKNYPPKELNIYDLSLHEVKDVKLFESEILNVKSISKYVFTSSNKEINVCFFDGTYHLSLSRKIPILNDNKNFEIFIQKKNENNNYIGVILFNTTTDSIKILTFYENRFEEDNEYTLNHTYSSIQNFFYVDILKQIFIVDGSGCYISSYNCNNFKLNKVEEYYRGKNEAVITSIIALNENYIAVANLNKTVHIFSINNKSGSNFITKMWSLLPSSNKIYSSIQIPIDNEDSELFDVSFRKNGIILNYNSNTNVLMFIGYNGMGYSYRLNLDKYTYTFIDSKTFIEQNLLELGRSINLGKNPSLVGTYNFDNNSIERNEKNDNWKII